MDISKYINEHLDEIIDNPDSLLNNSINTLNFLKHNESNGSNESNESVNSDDLDDLDNSNSETTSINNNYEKEPNEDDYADDIECELYQDMYEKKMNIKKPFKSFDKNIDINVENENEDEDEDSENKDEDSEDSSTKYYFDLMNIFLRYYNEKYDKSDNFFTGIKDNKTDTSNCMELFFESIFEYEQFKQKILEDIKSNTEISDDSINDLVMKFIFNESESDKIAHLFETWENQIYCLTYKNSKYFSPSLLICLNFINKNNLIYESWNIFNLRDN